MSGAVVVTLLTLLLAIQPVTTDFDMPALPTMQTQLDSSVAAAQLTLSVLIICFGFPQLLCGPFSDRFGRRPVLLAGLSLHTVAAVGSATASSIAGLDAWRAPQGVSIAAAVTALPAGLWLGLTLGGTVFPMTFAIGAFGAALALVAWTLVQRHGEPARTAPLVIEPRPA